jgi:hypothetical protein
VSRHGTGLTSRDGRGFSVGELNGAGITTLSARRLGLRVDVRRRSVLDDNVASLRGWSVPTAVKPAKEGEVKKLEEEVVKIEKEVEKEVKKEGAKVKKGARKVEKEVAAAVEKPVKVRRRKKKAPTEKQ